MAISWLHDKRTNSFSYITEMSVREYLEIAEGAHRDKGGIEGQREPLRTTTAKRIRRRMLEDLVAGAVIPPVVVGVTVPSTLFDKMPKISGRDIVEVLPKKSKEDLAIIDGMQRTTALWEASKESPAVLDHIIRVEFWVAKTAHSLVYRMLVLNTGQVPWTLSRQLSVVYRSLVSEIEQNVDNLTRIISPDTPGRRTRSGEFASNILVELYLSFSSRKVNVDTKERVYEQFAQLDFVENLARNEFQHQFYEVLRLFVEFDNAFSRFQPRETPTDTDTRRKRFSKGRNIFDSHPARIGFIVAAGQHVLGRTGALRTPEEQAERLKDLKEKLHKLLIKLKGLSESDLGEFLELDLLEEVLTIRTGKVGDHERRVFENGFKVLIAENEELHSMEPCWRAD